MQVTQTFDVQQVERKLNELWMQNAGAAKESEDGVMLRARVLNLLVYVTDENDLQLIDEMMLDLALLHPCRALLMVADEEGDDNEVEIDVASRCRLGAGSGGQHLCCEQVTLRAGGRFTAKLPSAGVSLLVSDLPVFIWWQARPRFEDQVWKSLTDAADRVIIDSALSRDPIEDLRLLAQFIGLSHGDGIKHSRANGVSDLNWARLTPWRTLLASFYDAPEHIEPLSHLIGVRIDYVAPEASREVVAPKALLLMGWLASRLGWHASNSQGQSQEIGQTYTLEKDGRTIDVEFRPSEHGAVHQGGLTRVELLVESETHRSFLAMRSEDCRDLETREASENRSRTTRVVSSADKSESTLLAAELEILSHDEIYEDAVTKAVELFCDSN